ncbi:LytTR family DNA-binding domain-containing protein, partial [Stenotrophomonas indicatrix]|uniref:LytTR family DNA-binding domain-containing protein n=1 Tax=Stenotrophomonas indicatrix TaxID=2045451 RepID=UPI001F0BAA20
IDGQRQARAAGSRVLGCTFPGDGGGQCAGQGHHRSWLVNRGQLRSIEPLDGGEALPHMADGARVPCSRRQLPLLRQALGG